MSAHHKVEIEYSHRNGERTPPTVKGAYWFIGQLCGRMWNYMLLYGGGHTVTKIDDEWEVPFSDCNGQWWGPVPVPQSAGERRREEYRKQAERFGGI